MQIVIFYGDSPFVLLRVIFFFLSILEDKSEDSLSHSHSYSLSLSPPSSGSSLRGPEVEGAEMRAAPRRFTATDVFA